MADNQVEPLSEREMEIVQLVAQGLSNKEIAKALYISPNTVKVHLRNIYTKLNASSRTEATMVALRMGWVQVDAEAAQEDETRPPVEEAPPARLPLPPLPLWKQIYLAATIVLIAVGLWLTWPRSARQAGPFSDLQRSEPGWVPGGISRWQPQAQMVAPRSRFAVAAHDDRIYVIGGETAEGVSAANDVYLRQADDWIHGPDKPTAVANVGAVVLDGTGGSGPRIYVPGGTLASGEMSARLEILDLDAGLWEQGSPLPTGVGAYAIVADGGAIYLFGGWDGASYLSLAVRYDPDADAWTRLSGMPTARAFAAAGAIGDRIYVVGGFDGQRELDICEAYAPAADTWGACPSMNAPRAGAGAAVIADTLYVVGGGWESYLVENEYFSPDQDDPLRGTWQTFPSPRLQEWRNLGVVANETTLYAMGGWDGTYLGATHAYRALYRLYLPSAMGQTGE